MNNLLNVGVMITMICFFLLNFYLRNLFKIFVRNETHSVLPDALRASTMFKNKESYRDHRDFDIW